MAKSQKVIITCAVTGSIHTPSMSPHIPVTASEIAEAPIGTAEAGAAVVHLHALHPEDRTRFEIECYDIGTLYTLTHFLERGIVKPPVFVQSVFGILGGIGPHPEDVMHMRRTADRLIGRENYHWSVLGAGRNQMPIAAMAAAMGGNVRVGLEDSLWLGAGKLAESNAAQVTKVRQIIEGLGLEIASPDEAREILVLKCGVKVNF